MTQLECREAKMFHAKVRHQRTGDMIDFRATVESCPDGTFRIGYSHAAQAKPDSAPWFSDSLSHANDMGIAENHIWSQIQALERAHGVHRWN